MCQLTESINQEHSHNILLLSSYCEQYFYLHYGLWCYHAFSLTVQVYDAQVEVINLSTGARYVVHESVIGDSVHLVMNYSSSTSPSTNQEKSDREEDESRICAYSRTSGFGHKIHGKTY